MCVCTRASLLARVPITTTDDRRPTTEDISSFIIVELIKRGSYINLILLNVFSKPLMAENGTSHCL